MYGALPEVEPSQACSTREGAPINEEIQAMSRNTRLASTPRWLLGVAAAGVLALVTLLPASASAAPIPGQLIVAFSASDHSRAHQMAGATVTGRIPELGVDIVRVPIGKEAAAIRAYRNRADVRYAEQDQTVEALADPGSSRQWYLENSSSTLQPDSSFVFDADIDAPAAWAVPGVLPQVKVAVLDTGIDQNHQDLVGKVVLQRDFAGSKSVEDKHGHGTHVAGTIAAIRDNSLGVAGIASNATLLNGKVLGDTGSGTCSAVASGMTWAADQGARVISMSLGGGGCTAQQSAVNYAWNKGSLVVAAAGNSSTSSPSYPAAYYPTLAVAATDNSDLLASFSNFGSWVEIAAPGESIYSTMTNHRSRLSNSLSYGYLSGTSMATPVVSAIAAMVQVSDSNANGRTNDELRARLIGTADRLSSLSKISGGRVNACRAVTGASSC